MLINQENFEKIYQDELTPKQKKVLPLFLAGQTDEQIAKELGATHRSTASHQLRNISTKFGFPPETEPDYRCNLIEMFAKNTIASASKDGTVKLWQSDGTLIKTIPLKSNYFVTHPEARNSLRPCSKSHRMNKEITCL